MTRKNILFFVFTLIMSFCLVSTSFADSGKPMFSDVDEKHWAREQIEDFAGKGIVDGYTDGTFRPDSGVTREEFCKLLVAMLGQGAEKPKTQTFSDVDKDRWSYAYVEMCRDFLTGYINPFGGLPSFRPEEFAAREDITVALVKMLGLDAEDIHNKDIVSDKFSDADKISPSLKDYVTLAVENDIINGYPDGTFRPGDRVSRAEAVVLLNRVSKQAVSDMMKPADKEDKEDKPDKEEIKEDINDKAEIEEDNTEKEEEKKEDTKDEETPKKIVGFAVVTKVSQARDENGEEVTRVSCVRGEKEGVVIFNERSQNQGVECNLKPGDVFMFNTDKLGNVTQYIAIARVTPDNGFEFVGGKSALEDALSTRKKPTELVLGYIENDRRKTNSKGEIITVNGESYVITDDTFKYTFDTTGRNKRIEISDFMYEADYFEFQEDSEDYGTACPILLRIVDGAVIDAYTTNAKVKVKIN